MTDYSHLIGPEPTPTPSPKFPTPWEAVGHQVQAANLNLVLNITHLRTDRGDQEALAAFIAEAVNEKIARDALTARMRAAFEDNRHQEAIEYMKRDVANTAGLMSGLGEANPALRAFTEAVREARERDLALEGYRQDVEYWTHGVSRQAFYRLDPEVDHPGPETIDTFYLDEETVNRGHLLESYVRQDKTPCSVLDVPEEFRL